MIARRAQRAETGIPRRRSGAWIYSPRIVRSPHGAVEIPQVPLSAFVLERAGELGDKPALIDATNARLVTYAELGVRVAACAGGLARRGFDRGDALALYAPNLPEYAIAFHGAVSAGGAVTTVNPLFTPEELTTQLRASGARLLVTDPA